MPHGTFKNESAVLSRWFGMLVVLGVAAFAVNVGIRQQVIDLRENSSWFYVKQGLERMRANDTDMALVLFRKGAEVEPGSPMPHENIGRLHYERQEFAKSAEAFERAIELGSVDPDARGKLLWSYVHTKRYAEAVAIGERSIKEGRSTPQFPRWIADAHYRAGNFEDCIRYFELALDTQEDLYVMSKLLSAYQHTGRTMKAEALRQRIEVLEAS